MLFYPQVGELTFPKMGDAKLPITRSCSVLRDISLRPSAAVFLDNDVILNGWTGLGAKMPVLRAVGYVSCGACVEKAV